MRRTVHGQSIVLRNRVEHRKQPPGTPWIVRWRGRERQHWAFRVSATADPGDPVSGDLAQPARLRGDVGTEALKERRVQQRLRQGGLGRIRQFLFGAESLQCRDQKRQHSGAQQFAVPGPP